MGDGPNLYLAVDRDDGTLLRGCATPAGWWTVPRLLTIMVTRWDHEDGQRVGTQSEAERLPGRR